MILLCLCSNQLWQNDGSYHQPAAFKHLKYTLSDLQPIRIQSDTYSWSILVLSTNQLYMQMPKVVLGLSDPPEWWGRYRASLSPCLIAGSQNYFRQCDKLLLMNEIHLIPLQHQKYPQVLRWMSELLNHLREGLFRYMEIVGLFFKQENTSNP